MICRGIEAIIERRRINDLRLMDPPTLGNVLQGSSSGSYSLENLRIFMLQNHCLELLNFLQEAEGYKESYYAVFVQLGPITHHSLQRPEIRELVILWRHLALTYIFRGSPHEIIITDTERERFSAMSSGLFPPPPYILNSTVERIYQVLANTIFPAFLYRQSEGTDSG